MAAHAPKRSEGQRAENGESMKTMVHGILRDLTAERIAYDQRCAAIARASSALAQAEIERTCARFELESDDFSAREQKAEFWR